MKKIFKKLLILFAIIVAIFLIFIAYIFIESHSMYKKAISEISIKDKFSSIQGQENFVTIDEVPQIFINAIISVEDRSFYSHKGINVLSIGRAVLKDITTLSLAEGGSTITQQIAKNLYFTQEKKFTRKAAEVFVAFDIEKQFSKDEILEIYINTNFYGSGYYGIYEASMRIL